MTAANISVAPLAEALLAAAQVVAAVIGGRNLDDALGAAKLEGVVRAAVQSLSYGTLRACGRGDFFLARLTQQPPADPLARALLLVALQRLDERPDEAHTTVDQAVTAAARIAGGRFKGLVNGVLRNFLRRRAELATLAEADDVAWLQHPRWWLDRLVTAYPRDWRDVARVANGHPPMCLRVNRRHGDAAAYLTELSGAGIDARALDDTAVLLAKPMPVERLPGFAAGRVSVQDWGAQHAAPLLGAATGMRVLDACAAPGGKTCHLLELADLELVAVEAETSRATRIGENLDRLGLTAEVRVGDCRRPDDWWDGRPFDRILADVPCTASGVARRHPDIKWLRRQADVDKFARPQREILDALWRVLAPGGRMLYCTCSVFTEENARQVAAFAARHADAVRVPIMATNAKHEWQLLPTAELDGFFYALLEKSS